MDLNDIYAKVILDSVSPSGKRITTFEVQCPLHAWVHLLTHRMLSRNAQSSRALPVNVIVDRAIYEPIFWHRNNKKMYSSKEISPAKQKIASAIWRINMFINKKSALFLNKALGVHKQIANRLVSPYIMIKGIVTATEWDNFINLRTAPDAQTEIQIVANDIKTLLSISKPKERTIHAPYIPNKILNLIQDKNFKKIWKVLNISAARCARISYLRHDGTANAKKDLELSIRLLNNGHMSPFEHVAIADDQPTYRSGNFYGWIQWREIVSATWNEIAAEMTGDANE